MADAPVPTARKPRADAERNRLRLLDAAKTVFADKGNDSSLEEIARTAGVGIGTLYRHFPTRDALIEQVYRNESEQLAQAAADLARTQPPVEALRLWMRLFVDYLATKQIMAEALNAMVSGPTELYAASGAQLKASIADLAGRAIASGAIRLDMEPLDLLRALVGVAQPAAGSAGRESAKRLVDMMIAGARVAD
ncbi:MAG: helix-turn-helix domain-containing protein [Sphingomonas sp.]